MGKVLGNYDAPALLALLQEYGVGRVLQSRGFRGPDLSIDDRTGALVNRRLYGWKGGVRYLLLEAALREGAAELAPLGGRELASIDLLVVQWVKEQDPTARFSAEHPRLPLQDHPGLGVLRRVFRVALRLGRDLSKDGLASYPKYPHDAAIFYRSRLFLFADPAEQGRFTALLRDLGDLSLRDISLAVIGGCVRREDGGSGTAISWHPGLQIFPLASRLADYFNSAEYARGVEEAAHARYWVDPAALAGMRRAFEVSAAI
jgi:hypothetical protein